MGSLNKVCLIGHLGKDAELRYTPSGAAIAKFSIATTETWNDKSGQRQERTEWHNVDLWGKQAESLAEYLRKGRQIYLEGRLQSRKALRCRGCDAFLPDRDYQKGQETTCGKCNETSEPYVSVLVSVNANQIVLLSDGNRNGGQRRQQDGSSTTGGHGQTEDFGGVDDFDVPHNELT